MTTLPDISAIDLTECDREPIHIPGLIQSHGWLFACHADSWNITHASENAAGVFAATRDELIGRDIGDVLGFKTRARLDDALARSRTLNVIVGRAFGVSPRGLVGRFNAAVHVHEGRRLVEIERASEGDATPPLDLVQAILARLRDTQTLNALCNETARQVLDLIGFDRTMIYRFLEDGSGQVVAESKVHELEPLLHLRYPASDIPKQARALYVKNWVRLIADVDAPTYRIDDASAPVDLSYVGLRGVSPVHLEYLRNMDVRASMSISIVVGGELWGLIACHNRQPKVVPANVRAAAELLGQVFSLQIQTVEGIEAYVTMRAARALLDRVISEFPADGEIINSLSERFSQFVAFLPCDGVGAWVDGAWRSAGDTPAQSEMPEFLSFVSQNCHGGVFSTHKLHEDYPPSRYWPEGICGVLAVPLSHSERNYLLFFRREVLQVLEWAGDPSKLVDANNAGRLSPRHSFAVWKQEVRGQSIPWSSRQRIVADAIRVYMLDIVIRFREVIQEERRRSEQEVRLAAKALNQRVKGTLELIQSLVARGYEESGSLLTFVTTLERRIRAVALAHSATASSTGAGARALLETALTTSEAPLRQVDLIGPEVLLEPKAYSVLALVVHELVSNALRYGALSAPGGRLIVTISVDADGQFVLLWNESGRVSMDRPGPERLGVTLIRNKVPFELGGKTDLLIDAGGARARIVIPGNFIARPHRVAEIAPPPRNAIAGALNSFSLLILDDNMLSALETERILVQQGATAELVSSADAALASLARGLPDVAVLDVDLGEGSSMPVAQELTALGVPFVFLGTDADRHLIEAAFAEAAIVRKPIVANDLIHAVRDAVMPNLIRAVLSNLR